MANWVNTVLTSMSGNHNTFHNENNNQYLLLICLHKHLQLYTLYTSHIHAVLSTVSAPNATTTPVSVTQHWRTRWRHQMETFSALLALCAGNSLVTGEFLSQRPVTRSFHVFFDLCLNKRLSKQPRRGWFETPWRSLWRHCNAISKYITQTTKSLYWYHNEKKNNSKSRHILRVILQQMK